MNTTNDNRDQPDNMEKLQQQAAECGHGCGCRSSGSSCKMGWGICIVVLIAAAVLAVRATTRPDAVTGSSVESSPPPPVAEASAAAPADAPATAAVAEASTARPMGRSIEGFADLNTIAEDTDAVFIVVPAAGQAGASSLERPLEAAARTMASRGIRCGLFTLDPASKDYSLIAPQIELPGVLAMVKGRGMTVVSGEMTEQKLLDGYLAAASAGGCGGGACPSGLGN